MQKELVYPASRARALLLLAGCAAFVAVGFLISKQNLLVGWLSIVFFGLGIPIAILMLFSRGMYLRLTADGFEMASLFNKTVIRWGDVDGFRIGRVRSVKMIAIIYRPDYKDQKMLRRVNSSLAGMEGAIPNIYAVPLDTLLAKLNEWHTQFSKKSSPPLSAG